MQEHILATLLEEFQRWEELLVRMGEENNLNYIKQKLYGIKNVDSAAPCSTYK